jgi:site-specific DNA-methyltransferase (adenine-specific)
MERTTRRVLTSMSVIDAANIRRSNTQRTSEDDSPRNTIILGDSLKVLPRLRSESVDLTVFSPPYDGIRDYGKDWTLDFKSLGEELHRVTVEGGVCAVVIGDGTKNFAKSLTTFRWAVDWVDRVGWRLFECCIYQRHGNPGAWWTQRFRVDHEYILIFFRGDRPRHFDKTTLMVPSKHAGKVYSGTDRLTNGGFKKIEPKAVNDLKCRGTVWDYATSNTEGNRTKLEHPATFPDKLAQDLIACFSKPGDLVLDPMCGSGTTCVMAVKARRGYLGIEINETYHRVALRRMKVEVEDEVIGEAGLARV